MSVAILILDGPLPAHQPVRPSDANGAIVVFDGIVRAVEASDRIDALDYEVYEPMATRQLAALAEQMIEKHRVSSMRVWHSRGRVPVGGSSFRLEVVAPHRKESLQAMDEFIDRMKRDVPIWKRVVRAAGC
jgi:molybdopterin synthase catalytic subunit